MGFKYINNRGFTLIEVAIILVIIGLLLGGLFKGNQLFDNANIKRLAADVGAIRTAHYSYLDRTGILPNQASIGQITSALASANSTADYFGLLAGQGFISSQNPIPPEGLALAYEAYYVADQAAADANNAVIPGRNQLCVTGVDGVIAQGLDFKFDNGDSTSGILQAETAIASPENAYEEGTLVTICLEL